MTDDFYVGEYKSKAGCLLVLLLLTAVAAGAVYWLYLRPKPTTQVEAAPAPTPATPHSEAAPTPAAAPAETPVADNGLQALAEARQLATQDQLEAARERALPILDQSKNAAAIAGAEALLGQVDVALVLSPRAMPEKTDYTVQAGDSLAALAKKNNTTVDVIRKGNNLPGATIRAGDRLRLFSGNFHITVDKSDNTLVLYLNDRFFKRYAVGTGQYGKTPVGEFFISDKIPNPPWWRSDGKLVPYGDTNNVLGTHWMALSTTNGSPIRGYGIHGTWQPETIGKQASAGCVRLLNSEVEELFTLVPENTPVTITD